MSTHNLNIHVGFPYYSRLLERTLDSRKSLIVNVQTKSLLAFCFQLFAFR